MGKNTTTKKLPITDPYSQKIVRLRPTKYPKVWLLAHAALAALFTFTFMYEFINSLKTSPFLPFIYLTHWNLTAQATYSILEFITDYSNILRQRTAIFRSRLFHCIVFPLSAFVAVYFWIFYFIDETLVLPEDPLDRHAEWYNQVVHTSIIPAIIIQSHASYHKLPSSVRRSMAITGIFGLTYILWTISLSTFTGIWPYGLMEKRPIYEQCFVMGFGLCLLIIFNHIGRVYHKYIWFES